MINHAVRDAIQTIVFRPDPDRPGSIDRQGAGLDSGATKLFRGVLAPRSVVQIPHAKLGAHVCHGCPHVTGMVRSDSEQYRMLERREVLHRLWCWFPAIEIVPCKPQVSGAVLRQPEPEPRGDAIGRPIATQAGISRLAERTFILGNSVAGYPSLPGMVLDHESDAGARVRHRGKLPVLQATQSSSGTDP